MRLDKELHIRISNEQYELLKKLGINVSEFVRNKIDEELENKTSEKLREKIKELEQTLEETRKKLAFIEQNKSNIEKDLEEIYFDFKKFNRAMFSDNENLQWLKGRYEYKGISPQKMLEYCKRRLKEEDR